MRKIRSDVALSLFLVLKESMISNIVCYTDVLVSRNTILARRRL